MMARDGVAPSPAFAVLLRKLLLPLGTGQAPGVAPGSSLTTALSRLVLSPAAVRAFTLPQELSQVNAGGGFVAFEATRGGNARVL